MNESPFDRQNDRRKPINGSMLSPFFTMGGGSNHGNSIYSNGRGSFHRMFGNSPDGPLFGGLGNGSPFPGFIKTRNRETPVLNFDSPAFQGGRSSYHALDLGPAIYDRENQSEILSQNLSSLSEASIENNDGEKKGLETLKRAPNETLMLDKDLKPENSKEVTMENVDANQPAQAFDDLGSNVVVIEKPQIAEEIQKQRELEAQEKAKKVQETPSQMPKPKRKRTKLSKKKRSKSWDEETAQIERKRLANQEKRRGSLAVRKDVVNKTLLRSMRRVIAEAFEEYSGINNLSAKEKKAKFIDLVDKFTRNYIPSIVEITVVHDNEENEDIISQEGVKFIIGLMVSQTLMRSHVEGVKKRCFFYQYHQLLNKYSHKKMQRLLKNSSFIYVIHKFKESGKLDDLIKSDSTLSKNPQVYYDAANSFISRQL